MDKKLISIFSNKTEVSLHTKSVIEKKLMAAGYAVTDDFSPDSELIVCIGGDGTFIEAVHTFDFPQCPFIGVNTGHLGFFQEISPGNIDLFINDYINGEYSVQDLNTVMATVITEDGSQHNHVGLNEITIRGRQSYSVHLFICIDGKPIERFSGDGILVATSAGSTAYNYSLGGSIVDPRLKLFQITPIAPINTTAYRSFTSSILLPSDHTLGVVPEQGENKIFLTNDSITTEYSNVKEVSVTTSDTTVKLLRFKDYDFWNKVKTKFL